MTMSTTVPTLLAQHQLRPGHDLVATATAGLLAISSVYPTGRLDLVIPTVGHPQLLKLLDLVTEAMDEPTAGDVDDAGGEVVADLEVAPGVHLSAVVRHGETPEASTFTLMKHGANVDTSGVTVGLLQAADLCNVALAAVSVLAEGAGATRH